jgi:hypothetical protein
MFGEFPFAEVPFGDLPEVRQPAPPPSGKRKPIVIPLPANPKILRGRAGAYQVLIVRDFPVKF